MIDRQLFSMMLKSGMVSVPTVLLKHYPALGLSEMDMMLLIHLIAFKTNEQTSFPTLEQIQSRMSAPPEQVIATIERLLKGGYIRIDETIDAETGVRSEAYNIDVLYDKLAPVLMEYVQSEVYDDGSVNGGLEVAVASEGGASPSPLFANRWVAASPRQEEVDIFTAFEQEFARPLSPIECETITSWLDEDQHSKELILAALKEAVFAGKLHFRYIDRILLEWQRNRITTVEQAREYTKQFRGNR